MTNDMPQQSFRMGWQNNHMTFAWYLEWDSAEASLSFTVVSFAKNKK